MTGTERYVTLGLARARAQWFSDVARWATSGSLAMDFVKTVSVEEVRAHLHSGRRFSVLLVDAKVPGVDRDLLELAAARGCTPVVVTDDHRDWSVVGAHTTLPSALDRAALEAVLDDCASPIGATDSLPGQVDPPDWPAGFRARTIVVTGPGGAGRSTIAMAVAQGLASDVAHAHTVVLADLCLHAEQGLLHDARDVIPGLTELMEGHRAGAQAVEDIRSLTFEIVDRRYHLLLGLRRHRDWTALRPRALRAALDGLRRAFTLVVADIDDDLEGEEATGSTDVEDRNVLARTTTELADVVVVVGAPGMKGTHSLLRVIRELTAAGVDAHRIVPVLNRAPRSRRARGELTRTFGELLAASNPGASILSPVFVPERRGLDEILRDGAPLPAAVVSPVAASVGSRLDHVAERAPAEPVADEPVRVSPGSLGSWWDDEEVAG